MAFAVDALARNARRSSGDAGLSRDFARHLNMFYGAAVGPSVGIAKLL